MNDHRSHPPAAPETWAPARRLAQTIFRPLERFLHIEAASGIVLLAAAAVALAWANSPWSARYDQIWHAPVTIGLGDFVTRRPLHFWINDGLMTVFFLVVGLEIRREIHEGELSDAKRAALPVAAALGGMIAPAAIFLALSGHPDARRGFGVPMATDIAFAVGVLALLGKRVPAALRVLLLALAIIDDIGAILVIAIFYSSGLAWLGLLVAAGGVALVLALQRVGVRGALAYALPGAVIWAGLLHAGVHPTITGVLLGLLTPARPWFGEDGFLAVAREAIDEFRGQSERHGHGAHDLLAPLGRIREAQREAVPPVVHIQARLHPWVAFGIMPLFALANAGVDVRTVSFGDPASMGIFVGVLAGLVLGKPLGILLASYATVRLGVSALPHGVAWRGVLVVGAVAGIGFTMAIFIAGLAFPDAAKLGAAKLGVLVASAIAGILGLVLGKFVLPAAPPPGAASTVGEAERSTES